MRTGSVEPSHDKKLADVIQESSSSAKLLSFIAILISTVALIVTAYFSYQDYIGDEKWNSGDTSLIIQTDGARHHCCDLSTLCFDAIP